MATPPQEDDFEQYKRPATPSSVAFSSPSGFDPTSVRDTAIREFGTLGKSILGIPGGVYHSFTDAPTAEEKQRFGVGDKPDLMQRVALGAGRMAYQPVTNAASDYGHGRVGVDQALSVLPEAMGTGAAAPIVGKMVEEIPGAVGAARNRIAPNPNFRPSIERIMEPQRTAYETPAPAQPNFPAFRPSIERLAPPGPEPDIETEMRLGTANPPPPELVRGVESRLGTPEEQARVSQAMLGRNAAKQDLESGRAPAAVAEPAETPSSNRTVYKGDTYEYRGGQFLKNGRVLENGANIADAVDVLEGQPGKVINAEPATPATNFQTLDPRMAALLEQLKQEPVAGAAPAPRGRPLRLAGEEIEPETDLEPALKRSVKEVKSKKK